MPSILVTPRSLTAAPHHAVENLRKRGYDVVYCEAGRIPSEAQLLSLIPGVVGWLAGVEPVSAAVIAAAHQLKVISRNGVGTDNLPLAALAQRGIAVRVTLGANAPGVAELTIGLMLAAIRSIVQSDHGIKQGQWPRQIGREIRGCTVGVIGYGAIGSEVARLCHALGANVLVYDAAADVAHHLASSGAHTQTPSLTQALNLRQLLMESDIVTLHCPATPDGSPVLNAKALAMMRPGAIVINTARAALVDEHALRDALNSDKLAGYATDVFVQEPPRDLILVGHPKVIATSHIGAYTSESVERATTLAVANLIDVLESPAQNVSP
jgi:D-3-phosphoglycerate dehydrogenase